MKPQARSGHVTVIVGNYLITLAGYKQDSSNQSHYYPLYEVWIYHLDLKQWFCKETGGRVPPGTSGARAEAVDKKLYLFGGHTHQGNTNDTYFLDLETWQWHYVSPPESLQRRFSPKDKAASWTYNSCIYMFGGFGAPSYGYMPCQGEYVPDPMSDRGWNNHLHEFNTESKTWRSPVTKGSIPSARAAHAAACVGHLVYIFGGRHRTERLNDLHCLNLSTMTWSGSLKIEGPVPRGRSWHSLSVISPSVLFLYGGFSQEEDPLGDGWLFDMAAMCWTQLFHLPIKPRLWHTACHTPEGHVYIFGGCVGNILSEEDPEHTGDLRCFMFTPDSLLELCMDTLVEQEIHVSEWTTLPRSLDTILQARLTAKNSLQPSSYDINHDSQATVCSVS